jgi:hypothetical protein
MVMTVGFEPGIRRRPAAALRQMTAAAREELLCVVPAEGCAGAPLGAVLPALARAAEAGVRVRLLCWPGALLWAEGSRLVRAAVPGDFQARVAEPPLRELLLVDGRIALARSRSAGAGGPARGPAAVARSPAVLGMLREIFGWAWDSAVPAADYRWLGGGAGDRLTGQILGLLQAGYKDDVAARRLGLSVRTYRRYVADLMRNMGAETRFQAGVRAAELGLLSAPPG